MAGVCQQIFTRAGIADNQQRRIEHRQFACLIQYLTHFAAYRDNVVEFTVVINGEIL
ncbi:hypothetical protein D3C79_1064070 [compost metagenome]